MKLLKRENLLGNINISFFKNLSRNTNTDSYRTLEREKNMLHFPNNKGMIDTLKVTK